VLNAYKFKEKAVHQFVPPVFQRNTSEQSLAIIHWNSFSLSFYISTSHLKLCSCVGTERQTNIQSYTQIHSFQITTSANQVRYICKVQLRARAWCKKIATMLCSLFAFMQCHQYAYNFKYTYFFTWESMNYTTKVVFCSRVELEDHRFNLYTDDCFTTLKSFLTLHN